jgi:hypothetical protein
MKRLLIALYVCGAGFLIAGCATTNTKLASATPAPAPKAALAAASEEAEGSKTLPGKLVFDNQDDPKNTKYAGYKDGKDKAPFDHKQHVDYKGSTCVTCHHTNSTKLVDSGGTASEFVMKCTACHTDTDKTPSPFEGTHETEKFKGKPSPEAEIAFHGPDASGGKAGAAGCITCHKQLGKEFPKAGKVTSCGDCHTGKDS